MPRAKLHKFLEESDDIHSLRVLRQLRHQKNGPRRDGQVSL